MLRIKGKTVQNGGDGQMKVYEFGENHEKTFAMFQCAAEPGWVFIPSAEAVARDYHVFLFIKVKVRSYLLKYLSEFFHFAYSKHSHFYNDYQVSGIILPYRDDS